MGNAMELATFKKIYESKGLRRSGLLERMSSLDTSNVNCSNCAGKCCTMMANSMMITPIEAVDLRSYLYEKWMWNDELKEKLKECVKDFRLDDMLNLGRGRTFRRTYTCPFYMSTFPGCPLPAEVKPYGCLGFNPTVGTPKEGEGCTTDLNLLEEREGHMASEEEINLRLKEYLDLDWDKKPIPVALLEIDEKFAAS